MTVHARTLLLVATLAGALAPVAGADAQFEAYRALDIEPKDVVVGNVLTADVIPDGGDEVVAVVTYFTGKKERREAVNVRLAVLRRVAGRLQPAFERDYGALRGGNVGRGELQLVDLDRDARHEIIVNFEDASDPLIARRHGEVLYWKDTSFVVGWEGETAYDATREARDVPPERRDRWVREVDIVGTLRTRGLTLFMTKTVYAVAGETLPQPKRLTETFPLRSRDAS
jgi:hypothetical protein